MRSVVGCRHGCLAGIPDGAPESIARAHSAVLSLGPRRMRVWMNAIGHVNTYTCVYDQQEFPALWEKRAGMRPGDSVHMKGLTDIA